VSKGRISRERVGGMREKTDIWRTRLKKKKPCSPQGEEIGGLCYSAGEVSGGNTNIRGKGETQFSQGSFDIDGKKGLEL